MTFEGGIGDFVWVRFFFQTYVDRIFFLTYNGVGFFPALYAVKDIFFKRSNFFPRNSHARIFSPRNQSAGYIYIFLKSPIHAPAP